MKLRFSSNFLLACGVVGLPLFIIFFLIEGATRPNYNPWRSWISHLSLGNQGWINSLGLIICGLLLLCFAAGVRQVFQSGKGATWGPLLFACSGLGLILAGIFVINPGLGYPPGVKPTFNMSGIIHNVAATLGFFAAVIANCFVLARRFAGDPHWKGWAIYSILTATGMLTAFIVCIVLASLDFAGILPGAPSGFFERISFITGATWYILLGLRLIREKKVGINILEEEKGRVPAKR